MGGGQAAVEQVALGDILYGIDDMYLLFFVISIFMLFGLIFGVMIMMLGVIFMVLCASFMFWMLVDAAKQDKFWWVAIMFVLPLIGSLVYFFVEKEREYAKIPKEKIKHKKDDTKEEKKEETKEVIKLAEGN